MRFGNRKFCGEDLLLYAVTDRRWLHGAALCEQVEQALLGGVTMVQLREKEMSGRQLFKEAEKLRALCAHYQVPFIVNDNVPVAKKVDADGVHLGQNDMDVPWARRLLGEDKIIGVSARTVEQAVLAWKQGADYLGTGAVFATGTKPDAQALSLECLTKVCKAVPIPVVAIGGITADNVARLSGSGICGVAVVSAIFAQPDIAQAAVRLREKVKEVL